MGKAVKAVLLAASSALLAISCSVPALEAPECFEARDALKGFYSFHLGNDMKFTPENLKQREKYLSPDLKALLQKLLTESDPFTLTDDPPRAFRTAGCRLVEPGRKTSFQVQLLWRNETASRQEEVTVEMIKEHDKWLIDNISNDRSDLKTLNH